MDPGQCDSDQLVDLVLWLCFYSFSCLFIHFCDYAYYAWCLVQIQPAGPGDAGQYSAANHSKWWNSITGCWLKGTAVNVTNITPAISEISHQREKSIMFASGVYLRMCFIGGIFEVLSPLFFQMESGQGDLGTLANVVTSLANLSDSLKDNLNNGDTSGSQQEEQSASEITRSVSSAHRGECLLRYLQGFVSYCNKTFWVVGFYGLWAE